MNRENGKIWEYSWGENGETEEAWEIPQTSRHYQPQLSPWYTETEIRDLADKDVGTARRI